MDKMIIYVSYDESQYVNYYHLICGNEKQIEFCPEEKLGQLFNIIKKSHCNIDLCIVRSRTASRWDFESDFNYNEIELEKDEKCKLNEICEVINQALDIEKTEDELEFVFQGKAVIKTADDNIGGIEEIEKTLVQAEEILKNGGEEMTELVRIIKEKYERMTCNE